MRNERVSVIIPNYNREKTIKHSILSVINQTYKNIEIIVVDDNSSDNSKELLMELTNQYKNLKVYFNNKNKGANFSRNKGAELSTGEYIAFLDSDDQFLPRKIERQMEILDRLKNNDIGIIFTNMLIKNKPMLHYKSDSFINIEDIIFRNRLGGFSSVLMKKDVFFEVGKLDEELLSCQDWDMYLKVLSKYSGYIISDPLVKYYLQDDSISKNFNKVIQGHNAIFNKIKKINNVKLLVNEKQLVYNQKLLLGDIYRRFGMFDEARRNYRYCIKYKKDIRTIIYIFSTLFGKRLYEFLVKLKF